MSWWLPRACGERIGADIVRGDLLVPPYNTLEARTRYRCPQRRATSCRVRFHLPNAATWTPPPPRLAAPTEGARTSCSVGACSVPSERRGPLAADVPCPRTCAPPWRRDRRTRSTGRARARPSLSRPAPRRSRSSWTPRPSLCRSSIGQGRSDLLEEVHDARPPLPLERGGHPGDVGPSGRAQYLELLAATGGTRGERLPSQPRQTRARGSRRS